MKLNVRLLYLYLFSLVGLTITVVGSVRLIELVLKVYVFKGADQYNYVAPLVPGSMKESTEEAKVRETQEKEIQSNETTRQRQREASGALAMLLVGLPLYKYHWKIIQKDGGRRKV